MLKDIQNPSIKINASGRVTPTTIILEENHGSLRTMDSFFSFSAEDALTSKRRIIELNLLTQKNRRCCAITHAILLHFLIQILKRKTLR